MNAWDTAEIPPAWNGQPLSHEDMLERINRLTAQYEFLHVTRLCETPDGQIIPLLVLGSGEKSVLYFGEDEGGCGLLLRFAEEYCAAYRHAGVLYGCSLPYLYKNRLLYVVPFLPSDQNGEEARNILENTLRTEDRLRGLVGVSSGGRYLACTRNPALRETVGRNLYGGELGERIFPCLFFRARGFVPVAACADIKEAKKARRK